MGKLLTILMRRFPGAEILHVGAQWTTFKIPHWQKQFAIYQEGAIDEMMPNGNYELTDSSAWLCGMLHWVIRNEPGNLR